MSVRNFRTKPVERQAYEIQPLDTIDQSLRHLEGICRVIPSAGGPPIVFSISTAPIPGDFVIFESEHDIYHCNRNVFLRKYEPVEITGT